VTQPSKSFNPAEPSKASPGFVSTSPPSLEIEPESVEGIERLAAGYVDAFVATDLSAPDSARTIAAIDRLGERDFVVTAAISGRLLDRRFRAVDALLGSKAPIARQLAELRKLAAKIDPTKLDLGGGRSPESDFRELDRYFERFNKLQPALQEVLSRLAEGRMFLEQDNAAIIQEQASLEIELETLRQYAYLAERIDRLASARIDEIAATEPTQAEALRMDFLSVVRRRRQEILVQLAVVTQGFAALQVVEDSNAEVVRALATAITTTTTAMRTAVMAAHAAASHRLALGQLHAAQQATSAMANHAAALEDGTSGPSGRVAVLRDAWSEVYAALDRVDAQKAQVLRTISQADRELTRPKPGSR
jgi:uncharacterized protein YaaN involved in tellurite resistance